jgi:ribose 5-phosphate isomerase B
MLGAGGAALVTRRSNPRFTTTPRRATRHRLRLHGKYPLGVRIAVAFDHRGVKLRERILAEIAGLGHEAVDLGTDAPEPRIDYPDKAREVGEAILGGAAERAVLVCGSGVGASVAACKLPGIRAAICHDAYSAHQGVEHDDMNVLCLGSEIVGEELAAELVRTFVNANFGGGERYVRRLEKIQAMERMDHG